MAQIHGALLAACVSPSTVRLVDRPFPQSARVSVFRTHNTLDTNVRENPFACAAYHTILPGNTSICSDETQQNTSRDTLYNHQEGALGTAGYSRTKITELYVCLKKKRLLQNIIYTHLYIINTHLYIITRFPSGDLISLSFSLLSLSCLSLQTETAYVAPPIMHHTKLAPSPPRAAAYPTYLY